MSRCPTCNSPGPHLHPATGFEGEVETCVDDFHLQQTPQNKPEYQRAVLEKRISKQSAALAAVGEK